MTRSTLHLAAWTLVVTLAACAVAPEFGSVRPRSDRSYECVILLHGLGRTSASMTRLQRALEDVEFRVANIDYPSRSAPIEQLASPAIESGLARCGTGQVNKVHFVAHSLGGILLRYYLRDHAIERLGRVVMLAPPNQGSEASDFWRRFPGFKLLNGFAGYQLGTDAGSVPRNLGPADFTVGVIAGDRTIDPVTSLLLPNPDDGKVSVTRTRLEGMSDFLVVHRSHAFIMQANEVIRQVIHFLDCGRFSRDEDGLSSSDCLPA